MFTGIVECVGSIQDRFHESIQDKTSEILTLWIEVGADMSTGQNILKSEGEVKLGDSMAVNGVCLTVTALKSDAFQCQLAPETLKKTNLGQLSVGDTVNLERSMAPGRRFGGHFVQGHIDCTCTILERWQNEAAVHYRFQLPENVAHYVVEKGYVAIDGISLTVVSRTDSDFEIMLIPFTQEHTGLTQKKVGEFVNLEVDMLAKYAHQSFRHMQQAGQPQKQ